MILWEKSSRQLAAPSEKPSKLVSNKWKVSGRHIESVVLLCDSIWLRFRCVTMVIVTAQKSFVACLSIVVDLQVNALVTMVKILKF